MEIDQLLKQEDIKWKQRAKQHWYQKEDRNTPFFQAWANHQKMINQIKWVRDDEDREWTKLEEIGQAYVNFYQKLFQSEGMVGIEECLEGLEARVIPEMNGWLLRRFLTKDVDFALSQMGPLKSLGPDGFAACFYQKARDVVQKKGICNCA